jgi:hypothetical protein
MIEKLTEIIKARITEIKGKRDNPVNTNQSTAIWQARIDELEKILKTLDSEEIELAIEEKADKDYMLGKVVTLEELPQRFRKESGDAYASGREDELAEFYRMMAIKFENESKQERKLYNERYHKGEML